MRGSIIGMGIASIACLAAGPAAATHHASSHHKATSAHHASGDHASSHHATKTAHHATSSDRHASHRHAEEHKASTPSGATAVPAGGIKLYCGTGRSPLMVRKMTQGAGTTVTVICR
jgi:hypothetical protein